MSKTVPQTAISRQLDSTMAKRRAADIQASGATSLRQVAAALNARHIKTSRRKDWAPTQVMRIMGHEKAPSGSV
ncbi:hypothetical protein DC522_29910 [Microvirga sp. KLBC 81]|uniref:recombinase family protein n=1 Tax=Microvirga sp. KLBC 81 TaxID=1862707 RepID=UPI000D51FB13|nr:recombinase family protein [Microvirga sp. KLBC 81]PVE20863.1 hypothetical protein DC522_29910 [Microvirga sp. KLBC 81]